MSSNFNSDDMVNAINGAGPAPIRASQESTRGAGAPQVRPSPQTSSTPPAGSSDKK